MTDLEMWTLVIGAAFPPVVSVVLKSPWPAWLKSLVAVVTSVGIGLVSAAIAGELTGKPIVTAILLAAISMKVAYEKWWKPVGIAPWVETRILP